MIVYRTRETSAGASLRPMRYLSTEWILAADAAVESMAPAAEPLSIRYLVTGGPDGERSHRVRFAPGPVGIETVAQNTEPAPNEVSFQLSWAAAASIAQGEMTARQAFLAGDLRLGGDPTTLLRAKPYLDEVSDRLAPLRARTDY